MMWTDVIILLQDYEVALSLGHLASLYTYDMEMFEQAEELYIRSIAIGKWNFYFPINKCFSQQVFS